MVWALDRLSPKAEIVACSGPVSKRNYTRGELKLSEWLTHPNRGVGHHHEGRVVTSQIAIVNVE